MKYAPLNYASIGCTPETIGPTVESVEQFELMSFFERRNNFLRFCKYLLNEASYRKRPLFMKYAPLNYASNCGTPETIGVTGELVEQFEVMSFFERQNKFLRFLHISPKGRILQKKPLIMKYAQLNYASTGGIPETIGVTGKSVEQFEIMSFFERRNNCLRFLQISPKGRILQKMPLFLKYAPLNYASIGGTPETIGPTGESVEQFEVMSFFERRNNFLRFLQISPKGRILQK